MNEILVSLERDASAVHHKYHTSHIFLNFQFLIGKALYNYHLSLGPQRKQRLENKFCICFYNIILHTCPERRNERQFPEGLGDHNTRGLPGSYLVSNLILLPSVASRAHFSQSTQRLSPFLARHFTRAGGSKEGGRWEHSPRNSPVSYLTTV